MSVLKLINFIQFQAQFCVILQPFAFDDIEAFDNHLKDILPCPTFKHLSH